MNKEKSDNKKINSSYLFGKITGVILFLSIIINYFDLIPKYSYLIGLISKYILLSLLFVFFVNFISLLVRKNTILFSLINIFQFYSGVIFRNEIFKLLIQVINYFKILFSFPKNIFLDILFFLLNVGAYICIFKSNNIYLLYSSVFILIFNVYITCYLLFAWIMNPLILMKWANYYGKKLWDLIIRGIKNQKEELYPDPAFKKLLNYFEKSIIGNLNKKYINKFSKEVNLKNKLIRSFLILLLTFLIFNIINFSLKFYALYKIDPNYIIGINKNYPDFLLFSITNLINFNFESVIINSFLTKFLVISEKYLSIYYLTVIIFVFTSITETAAEIRVKEAQKTITKIKNQLEDMRIKCEDWLEDNNENDKK